MSGNNMRRALIFILICLLCASAVMPYAALASGPLDMNVSHSLAQSLAMLPDKARARTDTIIMGITDLMGDVNPLFAKTQGDMLVSELLFDEWIFLDEYGKWGNGLADVAVSDDGLVYTFTLKPARYSDMALVSAEDCLNTLYLITMPGYDGNRGISMLEIEGLTEYLAGTADTVSGFAALSANVFQIRLTRANASAAGLFTLPALRVAHFGSNIRPAGMGESQEASTLFYEQRLSDARSVEPWLAGYGQYDLASIEVGASASFIANDDYWRAKASTPFIELMVVPVGGEYDAILNGDIDIAYAYPNTDAIDRVYAEGQGFVSMYVYDGDTYGYIGMDLTDSPFADIRVRQAFAHGLRRWTVVSETLERFGVLPGMMLFDTFGSGADVLGELYPYDSEKAAALLDEAGWLMGGDGLRMKDGQPFTLTFTAGIENPIANNFITELEHFCRYIGVELTIERPTLAELIERVEAGQCDMYLMARKLPALPAMAAGLFGGEDSRNLLKYDSEGLRRFFMWAGLEADPARQEMVYEGLFQQLYMELPMIPLYRRNDYLLVSARVRNTYISTGHSVLAEAYRMIVISQLESE